MYGRTLSDYMVKWMDASNAYRMAVESYEGYDIDYHLYYERERMKKAEREFLEKFKECLDKLGESNEHET